MKHAGFALSALGLGTLWTYFFVSAPPPLEASLAHGRRIPIAEALAALNAQNDQVRALYAQEIVGAGKARGFDFNEDWAKKEVVAGPLPALFLRETARYLEAHPTPLSLFLGSDKPINAANGFTGEQEAIFVRIRAERTPQSFYAADTKLHQAMFPDVASGKACVECHNEHPKSPKRDWKLGDVMGAVTWSHPESEVTLEELVIMSEALLAGVEGAYQAVLGELGALEPPPVIGGSWPRDGRFLPSTEVFMREVRSRASPALVEALFRGVRRGDVSE